MSKQHRPTVRCDASVQLLSPDADGRTHILKMLVIIQFKAYHRVYSQNCEG